MTIYLEPSKQSRSAAGQEQPASGSADPAPAAGPATEPARILLVDARPETLAAIRLALAGLPHRLVTAGSGGEALQCLAKEEFAAILLGVALPKLDGFQTARRIRQRPDSAQTPIVFLSGAEIQIPPDWASLGSVDFLHTSAAPEVVRSKVELLVELFEKNRQRKRQAEPGRPSSSDGRDPRREKASGRADSETEGNRFFALSLELLGIADLDGRLLQLNPSWERVLGFTPEELRHKSGLELVHPDDRAALRDQMAPLQRSDRTISFEGRYLRKDGAVRWLAWTAASVLADRKIYLFAREITLQKLAEQQVQRLNVALANRAAELEAANAELHRQMAVREQAELALKESNAELESFAYSVSHDLRAPLRAMQGFAQALVEDCAADLKPVGVEYAHRIISAATRLDHLIQDLLLYSRISDAKLELRPVEMGGIISEARVHLEAPLQESGARLTIEEPLLPVLGHHNTLVLIVGNLLSNAIKFVPSGVVPDVRLRMEPRGNMARLWIEDNGIGIAQEFHSRIFRVFERLHGVEAYPGTGIGLAIVRKGVERMGGSVGVDSTPQKGSRFWIELPQARDPD